MRFSLLSVMTATTVIGLCAAVFPMVGGGYYYAWNILPMISLIILSVSVTTPFFCPLSSRPFWLGYAISAAFFGILANSSDSFVQFFCRDVVRAIGSTQFVIGLDEPANFIASCTIVLQMLTPYVAGLLVGALVHIVNPATASGADQNRLDD